MPRNFFRRIETAFPIVDGNLRERIVSALLALPLADNARARILLPNGGYGPVARAAKGKVRRSQFEVIALAGNGAGRADAVIIFGDIGRITSCLSPHLSEEIPVARCTNPCNQLSG